MTRMACVLLVSLLTPGQLADEDWEWFEESRTAALDTLMPLAGHQGTFVAYRSHRDLYHDVPEQYFVIFGGPAPEPFEAEVVLPLGPSIQQQLLDMHLHDRSSSLESLVSRVRVQRLRLKEKGCPAIRERWKILEGIQVPLLPQEDLLVLHPLVHRVAVQFLSGQLDMRLYDDRHPLVRWSAETLTELHQCGRSQ